MVTEGEELDHAYRKRTNQASSTGVSVYFMSQDKEACEYLKVNGMEPENRKAGGVGDSSGGRTICNKDTGN